MVTRIPLLVYDNSRGALLRGRKTMLKVCAAQLKEQITTGLMNRKPIWVDLGGGTGKLQYGLDSIIH